jgi:hypothetical protein
MDTFESQYKEKFKAYFSEFLLEDKRKLLEVSNDINFGALEKDENGIAVVIKSGLGNLPSNPNYDMVTKTFNISYTCSANNLQEILKAINSMIIYYNSKWDSIIIDVYNPEDDVLEVRTYLYKPEFTTPTLVGEEYDLRLDDAGKTIKAVTVLMQVNVTYASNVDLDNETYYLEINGTKHLITGFINYEEHNQPSYDPSLKVGENILTQDLTSFNVAYVFTFVKSKSTLNTLHDILNNECWLPTNQMLGNYPLVLYKGETSVNIQTYSISKNVANNNIKTIILTLTR